MTIYLKNDVLDSKERMALAEALYQKGHSLENDGTALRLSRIENGLFVSAKKGVYEIGFSSRTSLMRAVGILCGHLEDECFETKQHQQKRIYLLLYHLK